MTASIPTKQVTGFMLGTGHVITDAPFTDKAIRVKATVSGSVMTTITVDHVDGTGTETFTVGNNELVTVENIRTQSLYEFMNRK